MAKSAIKKTSAAPIFTKGSVTGFRGSQMNQYQYQSIVKLDGVRDIKDTQYYLGKRVAYTYKPKTAGLPLRSIWGTIIRAHGNNGSVRVAFKKNLPGQALGKTVRVMLYPVVHNA